MTPVRGAGFIKQDTGVARDLEGHENLTESFEESCAELKESERSMRAKSCPPHEHHINGNTPFEVIRLSLKRTMKE